MSFAAPPHDPTLPGQLLARGVVRHLAEQGFACLEEFTPTRGLRVDVIALGPKGQVWVVECKSSRADFLSDHKWQGYLPYCDRFFWAVDRDFPVDLLPAETGLICADAHGAATLRDAPDHPLNAARRRALIQAFGRVAAQRLHALRDPLAGLG